MDDEDFRFTLDCAADDVTPAALRQAVSAFDKMLSEAGATDWRVSGLELHSVALAARPVVIDETSERAFHALDGITRLAARTDVSRDDASQFAGSIAALHDLAKETGANIIVSSPKASGTFTPSALSDINRLLIRSSRRSFGHVRGGVDKVILQPRHRVLGLIDAITQHRIDVRFGAALDPIVRQIQVGMEVDARGFARVHDGAVLSLEAEELEIIVPGHRSPATAEDLEGLVDPEFTGHLNSVDFASALRNAETTAGGAQ